LIKKELILKYVLLLLCYFVWPILVYLIINPSYTTGFLMILTLTGLIMLFYLFLDSMKDKEVIDSEKEIFIKILEFNLQNYEKRILRIDMDRFICVLALIFPNIFYLGMLLLRNESLFYLISIIPGLLLIIFALFMLYRNYTDITKVINRFKDDLNNNLTIENESLFLQRLLFLNRYQIFIYPKIKIILLVFTFFVSFVMPFFL